MLQTQERAQMRQKFQKVSRQRGVMPPFVKRMICPLTDRLWYQCAITLPDHLSEFPNFHLWQYGVCPIVTRRLPLQAA